MSKKTMTILILPVEGPPRVETRTGDSLAILQGIVGGYIEHIPSAFFAVGNPLKRLTVFGDEEARLKDKPRSPWTLVVRDDFGTDCDVLGDLCVELPRADHPAIEWARNTYRKMQGEGS